MTGDDFSCAYIPTSPKGVIPTELKSRVGQSAGQVQHTQGAV